jgi:hypothetical protein
MTLARRGHRFPAAVLALCSIAVACARVGGGSAAGGDILATLELERSFPTPFSYLSGLRELPDGRLLVADPLAQVVLRVDLTTGLADTLGRAGGGPQEYRQPDEVFPLPGDSTLLVDLGNGQLSIIGPDGTFFAGMPIARPSESGRLEVMLPRFVDQEGRIYFSGGGGAGPEGPADSLAVARYDRSTGAYDTVATVWRPRPQVSRSGASVRMMPVMMQGRDDWAVGLDGRVAVVRANGYSVEWHLPDGRSVSGPSNSFEALAIGDADKEAALEERSSAGLTIMMAANQGGVTNMRMSRGGPSGGEEPRTEDFQWAKSFPPFRSGRTLVSPEGDAWVERYLPAGSHPRMDVFGADGVRKGFVELPARRQVIGFGAAGDGGLAAYLVRTDDVGLKWLERYRVVPRRG